MKLEDQIVSVELAKRLKELGVKQDGFFTWYEGEICTGPNKNPKCGSSAFTVAELGMLLPVTLGSPPNQIDVEHFKYEDSYGIQVSDYVDKVPHMLWSINEKTEADARAKMLIYLIENKLINLTTRPETKRKGRKL